MSNEYKRTLIVDPEGRPIVMEEDTKLVPLSEQWPITLVLVPLAEHILFPGVTLPVVFPPGYIQEAMNFAVSQGKFVGFVPLKEAPSKEELEKSGIERYLTTSNLFEVGVLAKILKTINLPDGNQSFLIQALVRIKIVKLVRTVPYFIAKVEYPREEFTSSQEGEILWKTAKSTLLELAKTIPGLPEMFGIAIANIDSPHQLTDFVATYLDLKREERLTLLAEFNIVERLKLVTEILVRELELAKLAAKIREEIRQKVEKSQREFYLREQLKVIRRELGEELDQRELMLKEFKQKIESHGLSEEAKKRAEEELKKLEVLPPDSPEFNVIRIYLEWLLSLPWNKKTEDNMDIKKAREILDEDHYGLEEVKERILEYIAVRKIKKNPRGAILCFAGPPGVGKTSLGQSIARALGRKFYRFSLGGMRDEAEIKGHRRTYIGAMPGKILQGLKAVGVKNPVFMLDEIDKLGSDWRGDPSSAMLEVLDPAQNHAFHDHYIDLPFDLSEVMFICTANVKANIPLPLLDRMEVIELPGYIIDEKVNIAAKYLLPRQREEHGLKPHNLKITNKTLEAIIEGWTQEAGVRQLERCIGRICRKVASRIAETEQDLSITITPQMLPNYLGPRIYIIEDEISKRLKPGVVIGLAWTPFGGDILFVEAIKMPGKGRLNLTGQLGQVMNESAQISLSYVRSHYKEFNIPMSSFEKYDLHIHFPSGAVPKDGPSAGITITTAIISLLSGGEGVSVLPRVAMSGEMTLRGEVLPVGGIREKVVAAKRVGIKRVILPEGNMANVEEIPEKVKRGIEFIYAKTYNDVLKAAFPEDAFKNKKKEKNK